MLIMHTADALTLHPAMTTPAGREKRRRRNAQSPAANIPHDLLVSEVFLRLPVESLMRGKSVCRSWRAAVEDPDFVRRHLELSRARPTSMLVVPCGHYPSDASESTDVSFHRLVLDEARTPDTADVALMFEKAWPEGVANDILPTHCDGLVAIATATDQIFVCNPATREFVALPHGSRDVHDVKSPVVAFGYDPWRGRYVVARYFYRKYDLRQDVVTGDRSLEYDIGHEIFTLGDGGSSCWVSTADPPHAIVAARPICTPGALYWCASELEPSALLRFCLRDRAFSVVPCPPGTDFVYRADYLAELDGKLCYLHSASETAFDVWVADDGPQPDWSLRSRVDFSNCRPGIGEDDLRLVAAGEDEILIAADYKSVYSYDARRKAVKLVVDIEAELEYERADGSTYPGYLVQHHVVPYVESLVPISARSYR